MIDLMPMDATPKTTIFPQCRLPMRCADRLVAFRDDAGLVLSFDTFRDYQDFKEAKEISESAKAEAAKPEGVTPMVNVTCAAPLTPALKRPVKN